MTAPTFTTLADAAAWYDGWLREAALLLWANAGVDASTGAFQEALTLQGSALDTPRRARVQTRQIFVYASAAQAGFGEPWLAVAQRGLRFYQAHYRRPDGLFAVLVDARGRVVDDTPCLYEQAFSLFAMAAISSAGGDDLSAEAGRLLSALQARRHSAGGFLELGAHPFQANAQMHLLEAAMAWEERGAGPVWTGLTDELVALCLAHFVDAKRGLLREFFDADWAPAAGDDGRLIEPGHQFEWAWLLERWGRARGEPDACEIARQLFQAGLRGVDRTRGVAINALWDDFRIKDASARLWPQTEYLKAALILGEETEALNAAHGLAQYLDVPIRGAWRDKLRPDGAFVDEPAPASSFYHIMVAVLELMGRA